MLGRFVDEGSGVWLCESKTQVRKLELLAVIVWQTVTRTGWSQTQPSDVRPTSARVRRRSEGERRDMIADTSDQ